MNRNTGSASGLNIRGDRDWLHMALPRHGQSLYGNQERALNLRPYTPQKGPQPSPERALNPQL